MTSIELAFSVKELEAAYRKIVYYLAQKRALTLFDKMDSETKEKLAKAALAGHASLVKKIIDESSHSELVGFSIRQLQQHAKSIGVRYWSKMNKVELVRAIQKQKEGAKTCLSKR
jgi:hypothetical protein